MNSNFMFRAYDPHYGLSDSFTFGWVITFQNKTVFKSHVAEGMDVMQFTSLKDKNGKDIFSGDIVIAFIGGQPYGTGKVVFHNGIFWIDWLDDKEASMEPVGCLAKPFGKVREPLEVIGNIYQDKHLLQ